MLCLQQVETLTLEGSSFKVPGKGWLFQLGMKREKEVSKIRSNLGINVGLHQNQVVCVIS